MQTNHTTPLVSIIIPVYNAEKTILKCINSILEQDYSNIEVICVDDGSKDDSALVIKKICDKRIALYQKANEGSFPTRNFGLDKACGEFISFIDADDYISPDFISKNIKYMMEDKELDIVQVPFVMIDCEGKELSSTKQDSQFYYNETEYLRAYFEGTITGFVCAKIVRKVVYDKIRFPLLKCSGDSYIQPSLAFYARKTYLSSVGKYYYYQNPESISKTIYTTQKTEDSLKMHSHTYEVLYDNLSLRDLRANRFMLSISMVGYAMREFGSEFSESYIEFFAKRTPSFYDVIISNISVKKKIKIVLLKVIGISNYCKIVK